MNQTIAVNGVGTAAAPPELAIVQIGVDVIARTVAGARATAATGMAGIIDALRTGGLQDGDLTTTSYEIHPEYDHREGRRLRGFRVANTVEARISALDRLGEIIDSATEAGSDHAVVRGLRFAHDDDKSLASQARNAAWADAEAKATQLAELAGVSLGPVTAIAERSAHPSPMRAMAMEAVAAPPMEPGDLALTVSIDVEFAIRDQGP